MSTRLFSTYPAQPTFGVSLAVQNAGDYILQKKTKRSYCNISLCKQMNKVSSQSELLLLRKSNYLYNKCNSQFFNTANLNVNLYTKLKLNDVKVIANSSTGESPTKIEKTSTDVTSTDPSYVTYTIDPCGELFGNTTCGVNNYQKFLVYNPPYGSVNGTSNIINYNNTFNCPNYFPNFKND